MIFFTTCKVNIGLNIVARRQDGYHDIETLMVPIDWHDVLEIVPAKGDKTTLTVLGRQVDCAPEDNLVMKAYRALDAVSPLPPVDIYLEKIVPDQAGLGGGSADASFTLTGLNEIFSLGLSKERLAEIAATLGADCPLFVYNRPMLATGTGTTLQPVDIGLTHYYIVIVKPDIKVPTREAYAGVTPASWSTPLKEMLTDIVSAAPANDFEASVFARHPRLQAIKQE
ncbi:MAG: 4-(cytidine 5'-diphospho)-2-C-methyl-D-erythritol kinase, partial [Muribaculaceae bacterium]|nr:4-(cytidine 5'-diphospho)-2-C-methyl-D-erythritol kinase [Muribaculaceae bacterium]